MKGYLNQSQIEYVIFHLRMHLNLTQEIEKCFVFRTGDNDPVSPKNSIIFNLSKIEFIREKIIAINSIPILFPIYSDTDFFSIDQDDNLCFHHDILKSIFYLLSGYQEYSNNDSRDNLGRYAFADSLQHKLNIVGKPLVNYYFENLLKGMEVFCSLHNLSFQRRRPFETIGLLLTHDVDYIDKYTVNYWIYKLKEILGLRPSRLSRFRNCLLFLRGISSYVGISRKNPYWNFAWIRSTEKKYNWKSVFYFLDKGIKHSDASYSFHEKRIKDLFKELTADSCEIGVHGRVRSIDNAANMKESRDKLREISRTTVEGIRQHRLLWKHPETALIQESVGFKYDTTLGFAAHEGFRNSYCYPFRLFDFEKNRMSALWELPLTVMDVTLFAYQNYTPEQALKACRKLLDEVSTFGGIFTILWHNSFFEEETYPGVTKFYLDLLDLVAEYRPTNGTGLELTKYIEHFQRQHD